MTLPVSPNPISMSQVDVELGNTATTLITLNDTSVRTLFVKPSGQIALGDGYGKSGALYTPTITLASVAVNQLSFTWTVTTGATYYYSFNGAAYVSTATASYTTPATLAGNTSYSMRVYVTKSGMTNSGVATLSPVALTKPAAPTLTITVGSYLVQVAWSAASGVTYDVTVGNDTYYAATSPLRAIDRIPNTTYAVSVATSNASGIGNTATGSATTSNTITAAVIGTTAGANSPLDEQDWYSFACTETATYKLQANFVTAAFDPYLFLFDSSFNELAHNDDYNAAINLNSLIYYTLSASTTYYLRVQTVSVATGSYQVVIGDYITMPSLSTASTVTTATWSFAVAPTGNIAQWSLDKVSITDLAAAATSYQRTGLSGSTPYSLYVRYKNTTTGYVTRWATASVTTAAGLAAPTFTAPTIAADQIIWNWSAVSGATYQTSTDNSNWSASSSALTFTRTGLTENTPYTLYVRSVNVSNEPGASSNQSNTTIYAVVAGVSVGTVTTTGGTISWTAKTGSPTYNIRVTDVATGAITNLTSTTNSKLFSTGAEMSQYTVELQVGTAAWSGAVLFTTAELGTSNAITLTVESIYPNRLQSIGDNDYYKFTPSYTGSYTMRTITSANVPDSYLILEDGSFIGPEITHNDDGGLTPSYDSKITWTLTGGTTYGIIMHSLNYNSMGDYSIVVRADAPSVPSLSIGTVNVSSFIATFAATGASSYNLSSVPSAGTTVNYTNTTSPKQVNVLEAGGTTYNVTVTAVGVNGNSTNTATVYTKLAPPVFTASTGGYRSVSFTWSAVTGATGYTIVFNGATTTQSTLTFTNPASPVLSDTTAYGISVTATNSTYPSSDAATSSATTQGILNVPVVTATWGAGQVIYTWSAITNATSYTYYYADAPTYLLSTAALTLTRPITAQSDSSVYVRAEATNYTPSAYSTIATGTSCTTLTSGTTANGTVATASRPIYYIFIPPTTGQYSIWQKSGTLADTYLYIDNANHVNGGVANVDYNDDVVPGVTTNGSLVMKTLTASTTYFIRAAGYSTTLGTFTLNASPTTQITNILITSTQLVGNVNFSYSVPTTLGCIMYIRLSGTTTWSSDVAGTAASYTYPTATDGATIAVQYYTSATGYFDSSITTTSNTSIAVPSPVNTIAVTDNGPSLTVTWADGTNVGTSWVVTVKNNAGTVVATSAALSSRTYTHTVAPGLNRTFDIVAKGTIGGTVYTSTVASSTVTYCKTAMTVVSSTPSAAVGNNVAIFSWAAVSGSSFLYSSTSTGAETALTAATLTKSETVGGGVTTDRFIRAVSADTNYSNARTQMTTTTLCVTPAAPTYTSAAAWSWRVNWVVPTGCVTSYVKDSVGAVVTAVAAPTAYLNVTDNNFNVSHTYTVSCRNSVAADTPYSTASAVIWTAPAIASWTSVANATTIVMTWTAVSGVTYTVAIDGTTQSGNKTSPYTTPVITANTKHNFLLTSTNAGWNNFNASPTDVWTLPATPSTPVATTSGVGLTAQASVAWTIITDITYELFRNTVSLGIKTTSPFVDNVAAGFLPGVSTVYYVRAKGTTSGLYSTANSANSTAVTIAKTAMSTLVAGTCSTAISKGFTANWTAVVVGTYGTTTYTVQVYTGTTLRATIAGCTGTSKAISGTIGTQNYVMLGSTAYNIRITPEANTYYNVAAAASPASAAITTLA